MASFYGGPAGSSFELKEIFRSKVDMYNDLQQRWQSPIGVGDFVFISYGLPGDKDDEFNINQEKDLDKYKRTYNSTLWQKIYIEDSKEQKDKLTGIEVFFVIGSYGLGYRLITSMTGNTPTFDIKKEILNAGETPRIELDNTIVDNPVITFYLPAGQKIKQLDTELLDANLDPEVIYDDTIDVNNPTLQFKLPHRQNIKLGTVTPQPAGTPPEVSLDESDINNPKLNFKLPESQVVKISGETDVLDANENPSLTVDNTNPTNPELLFHLPRSQVMQDPETVVAAPNMAPAVRDIGTVNEPKLEFKLPRAVHFVYGSLLGKRTEPSYTIELQELEPGDYYINEQTGFVYQVISKTGNESTVVYVSCLQAPLPELETQTKAPYEKNETGTWVQSEPEIEGTYTDTENNTGWLWNLILPQLPNFDTRYNFIGATEEGSVTASPQTENLLRFTFNIPRGSRIFTGTEITKDNLTVAITSAKLGDYYLNVDINNKLSCGDVYQLIAENTWQLQGNIRGPIGERLSTVASYNLSNESGDSIDAIASADTLPITAPIVAQLYGKTLEPYEMIAVNYVYHGDTTSYWYFCIDSVWDRVKLTGGMGQILKNEYVPQTDTSVNPSEVVYTVDYINKLIVPEPTDLNKDIKTYNARKIDALITQLSEDIEEASNTWGNFEDLIPNETV